MAKSSPKQIENTVGKGEITSNFFFSQSISKRILLLELKTRACLGKGSAFLSQNLTQVHSVNTSSQQINLWDIFSFEIQVRPK